MSVRGLTVATDSHLLELVSKIRLVKGHDFGRAAIAAKLDEVLQTAEKLLALKEQRDSPCG